MTSQNVKIAVKLLTIYGAGSSSGIGTVSLHPISLISLNPAMNTPSMATITIRIMFVSCVPGNVKRSVPTGP